MHLVSSSQAASLARPSFGAAVFAKTHSFQDPKNFTYIINSNNRLQTLSHRLRDRTRTLLPLTSLIYTYSLVTLSSLRAHNVPQGLF